MTLERISESDDDEQFRKAVKKAIDSAKEEIIVITGELGSYAFPELQQSVQQALARNIRAKFYANENAPKKFITDIRKKGGEVFIGNFRSRDHYLVIDKNMFIVSEKEGLEIPTKTGTRRSIRSKDQPEDAKKITRFFEELINTKKKTIIMKIADIIFRTFNPSQTKFPKEPKINEVIIALENPIYDWRTVDGITKETNLSAERVLQIISSFENDIIRSPIPDDKGYSLYTTRDHYYKTHGLVSRFLTAVSGRIRV